MTKTKSTLADHQASIDKLKADVDRWQQAFGFLSDLFKSANGNIKALNEENAEQSKLVRELTDSVVKLTARVKALEAEPRPLRWERN